MKSILNEIVSLRRGEILIADRNNSNHYCVIANENNRTKTAYCFGVPIYNQKTKKLIKLNFDKEGDVWKSYGSNGHVTVTDSIHIENEYGFCRVKLPGGVGYTYETKAVYGNAEILPSLNGIFVKAPCAAHQRFTVRMLLSQPFMNVRANDRCFSLMREEFKPFVTLSCIGVLDSSGQMIAPCCIEYSKSSDREYEVTLSHKSPYGVTLLFEINLHAEKLFQDTTVESLHTDVNNAFGSTAFIGNTASYGEQWLYSRTDFSKLPEICDKEICKAVLHIPRFGGSGALTAFGLTARFCSFGSNWSNKVPPADEITDAVLSCGYQSLEITDIITDQAHFLKHSEGLILKPSVRGGGFSAVSTGDSCFAPQILEINFR